MCLKHKWEYSKELVEKRDKDGNAFYSVHGFRVTPEIKKIPRSRTCSKCCLTQEIKHFSLYGVSMFDYIDVDKIPMDGDVWYKKFRLIRNLYLCTIVASILLMGYYEFYFPIIYSPLPIVIMMLVMVYCWKSLMIYNDRAWHDVRSEIFYR